MVIRNLELLFLVDWSEIDLAGISCWSVEKEMRPQLSILKHASEQISMIHIFKFTSSVEFNNTNTLKINNKYDE